MAKLIIKVPGAPVSELDLPPGIHTLGRSAAAEFQINHPSVSGSHCQIVVDDGGATIKDLGSTNGTWLDGQRIEQGLLQPGHAVRLGQVEVVFEPPPAPAPALMLAPDGSDAGAPQAVSPPPLQARMIPTGPRPRPGNFYRNIPGAFVYPLKGWGLILLGLGTLVFAIFNRLPFFERPVTMLAVTGSPSGFFAYLGMQLTNPFTGLWLIFTALVTGYIFLFMQNIIVTSANGENRLPSWPAFGNWWDDAIQPYLRFLGILACCVAPAILWRSYAGDALRFGVLPLGLLGLIYLPMALLAVTISDSLFALDPRLVVRSISRIPAEYATNCVLFVLIMYLTYAVPRWVVALHIPLFRYAVYRMMLRQFFFLYFTAVEMRLLGLLYNLKRKRLGWRP